MKLLTLFLLLITNQVYSKNKIGTILDCYTDYSWEEGKVSQFIGSVVASPNEYAKLLLRKDSPNKEYKGKFLFSKKFLNEHQLSKKLYYIAHIMPETKNGCSQTGINIRFSENQNNSTGRISSRSCENPRISKGKFSKFGQTTCILRSKFNSISNR